LFHFHRSDWRSVMTSKRSFWSLLISIIVPLLLLVFPVHVGTAAKRANTRPVEEVKQRAAASYGKLPLSFEINQGQTDPRVKFLSRASGYTLFLTGNEAVLSLQKKAGVAPPFRAARAGQKPGAMTSVDKPTTDNGARTTNALLRTRLVGANVKAAVSGAEELPGKSNYFIGNDPQKWRTNVPNYAKVRYQGVYPGVDLVYYGNQGGRLEYDFVVAPGADPSVVTLEVGAEGVRPAKGQRRSPLQIAADGDLVVKTEGGEIRFQKPVVYQPMRGDPKPQVQNRKLLDGRYVLLANNRVGFETRNYDKTKPLVIDPVLSYSTYLGGSGVEGAAGSVSIAVDASGNAYVASGTSSLNFPVTTGAFQTTFGGAPTVCPQAWACGDAVVAKIDLTGSTLLYSTYLGGSGDDYAYGLAVDSVGNAYVTGVTSSGNFPTTAGAFQTAPGGGYDIFVTKLNATGSGLIYSTYLGGKYDETVQALAIDSSGDAYVAGGSSSPYFPTTSGAYDTTFSSEKAAALACGSSETPEPCPYAIVTELNPAGAGLIYSTFLGGSGDDAAYGLAVDSSGAAYVAGATSSTDFPTLGAYQSSLRAGLCGTAPSTWQCPNTFLTKLNAAGSGLVYSTYLGGSGNEYPLSVAVDSSGSAYVVGLTASNDFPTTPAAFQTKFAGPYVPGCFVWSGCDDAFVSKIDTTKTGPSSLVYSTYLGGTGSDGGSGIAVDSSGNAYVTGSTNSTDFPVVDAPQPANAGGSDVFVTELSPDGTRLISSTYLGGSGDEIGDSIAVDSSGNVYVGGWTESANFPTTPGSVQPMSGGARDLFMAKILTSLEVSAGTLTFPLTDVGSTTSPQTLTLTNTGTGPMSVNITTSPGFSETNNCPTTLAVGASCTIWITSTPTGGGTQAGQLIIGGAPSGPAVVPLTVQGILPGNIATLAGGGANSAVATRAVIVEPSCVAVDKFGNTFVASRVMNQVFKADSAGNFTVVAGNGTGGFGGDGGPATSASLSYPLGVAVDSAGNLYIADEANQRIRRVDTSGTITTVAGNGTGGYNGDNIAATSAELYYPTGVAVDSAGNLFIADSSNYVVRRVDASTGFITTVAGNGHSGFSGDNGPATNASLALPSGVAVDGAGNLFIADMWNSRIRRVDATTRIITTFAGGGTDGLGDGGLATSASLALPSGVALDGSGNLFIADWLSERIRRVDAVAGTISTVAGNGTAGFSGDGGPATSASLNQAYGVAVDGSGNLFIGDTDNNRIRRVDAATGTISTAAGSGSDGDGGPATSALLVAPSGIVADAAGNLFIADTSNSRIRRVDATTGAISTVAGNGAQAFSGDGGPATSASLGDPSGVAVDGSGNLFIADTNNNRIRKVAAGVITTVAGNGAQGSSGDGGPATIASFHGVYGVAVDGSGNLFIADRWNNRIRRVDASTGNITTVAGNGTASFGGDGGPATSATLNQAYGVAVDSSGNVFIADYGNNRIRVVNMQATAIKVAGVTIPAGDIATVAGNGSVGLSGDGGSATSASLCAPDSVAVDGSGNLFVADSCNYVVRRVDAVTGIITTVAGNGAYGFTGDGGPATTASLSFPYGVAVEAGGNLFIADTYNNRIREVLLAPAVTLSTASLSFSAQLVNTTSLAQSVTVTNTGGANLTISSIVASGTYTQTNTCPTFPATLNPGSTCAIRVMFTATAVGTQTGTLTITDNAAGSPHTVGLSGTGVTSILGSAVSLAPASLNFPAQNVGTTSSPLLVTLTNTGVSPLTISSIVTSVNYTQTNTCPSPSATLAPQANCSISVTFAPTVAGSDPGTLTITDNAGDSPQSVPLAATFTTPQQPVSPGTSTTFTNAAIMSETVTLPSDAIMNATASKAVSFIPVSPAVFSSTRLPGTIQDPNWSGGITPIPAGTTCTVIANTGGNCIVIRDLCFDSGGNRITCNITAPTTPIQLTAHYETPSSPSCPGYIIADDNQPNWAIITNAYYPGDTTIGGGTKTLNTDTAVVDLGAGNCVTSITGPAVSLAPASLVFPAQSVGTTSSPLVVTLTNTGVLPLTISSIATSGDYAQTNTCPIPSATLPPQANCSISVTFKPTVAGTDPGMLTITDNASGSPQSVPLAATFTTSQQSVSPGNSTTFTNGTIMSEKVQLPPDAVMNGTASKAVSFIPVSPAVFSSTRLPGTPQSPNWSGGITPIPAGTTCTVIANTGGNCIVIRDLCFDSGGNRITCNITATTPIQLTSQYETPSSPSCPGYIIADDDQKNWAVITNAYSPGDTTIGGGTKTLNTDTAVVDLGAVNCVTSITGPAVSLAPPSLSFPAPSSPLVVTLTNTGVLPLTISNIATSGDYAQTNTCLSPSPTLAPQANCSISVTFKPTVASTDPGTLTITDNASNSPQSVPLAATFTTPQQPVSPGTSTTFNNATIMSETVLLPPDANMTGTGTVATAFKAVSFIPVPPAVFSWTRLPGTPQNPNWSGGITPIPAATTCTVIANTGGNCIVIRDLCFDSNHKSMTCNITAPTTPIQLTSHYETPSSPSCPGYIIADDNQPNWAVITNAYYPSDTTIGGGTKTLNTDTTVVDLGAGNCASAFSGTTAPTTSAVTIPSMPNGANGWFTTSPVTVILASTGDALVKQISYSINGGAPLTVPGASTLLQITNQGVTTISYQATDEVGNVEALKTLVVKIDTTPPVVSVTGVTNGATYTLGAVPTAGCSTIDAISGVATAASLTLTGGVPPGVGSFTATCSGAVDMAGNRQAAPVTATYTVTPGPLASVSPSSINFGTVYLGTITTKNVTVTNQGDAPMTITDPILSIVSGGNSKEFVALNLCPKSLAAGKSCTIYVIFVAGPFYTPQTATLKVMDNAPGSPQTVVLSATVINPQAHLSATSLSFGTQKVGTSNAAKAVTLTNTGATALTITSIAIAGTNPLDFVQTNNCPSSLAANAGCTVYVTFKPTASGLRSASAVITDNAQNSPQNISLSGTGK
jgi:sugar lactone lactonase YvrE